MDFVNELVGAGLNSTMTELYLNSSIVLSQLIPLLQRLPLLCGLVYNPSLRETQDVESEIEEEEAAEWIKKYFYISTTLTELSLSKVYIDEGKPKSSNTWHDPFDMLFNNDDGNRSIKSLRLSIDFNTSLLFKTLSTNNTLTYISLIIFFDQFESVKQIIQHNTTIKILSIHLCPDIHGRKIGDGIVPLIVNNNVLQELVWHEFQFPQGILLPISSINLLDSSTSLLRVSIDDWQYTRFMVSEPFKSEHDIFGKYSHQKKRPTESVKRVCGGPRKSFEK